ncbi:M28 family peptidase [Planobispora takensis]|uniref:Peptidase M28 n=1 Tax=Planobispora takensis TaxID=1367882 RepID=A0A8J3SXA8_9ACTN|nr:M28 family peptidase [Planobispora takensis]GII02324.1 peptidase M28 [Planobispora takensis]
MKTKVKLGTAAVLAVAVLASPALVGTAGAAAPPSGPTDPVPLSGVRESRDAFVPPGPDDRKRAIATADKTLAAESGTVRKAPEDKFEQVGVVTGTHGVQYVHYRRIYDGLPVYGGDVIVVTDKSGETVQSLSSGQSAPIDVDTTPTVSARTAAATARGELRSVKSAAEPVLVVHAATAEPRLAWEVLVTGRTAEAPSVLHVYVDARTGAVIDKVDDVRAGTGSGHYNGNVTIATSGSGGSYSMTDTTRPGLRCGGQNGSAYTGPDDSWGNGQGTNLETACVDAMYAAQKEWDMLREWLGRSGFNGNGGAFPARVGLNDVNAYWNGSYTNFGHNQANTKQATPIDVVAHEFGHAVFQFSGSGGSGSGNEAGGLNESTGDIMGALTEHYVNAPATYDEPDYLVGEEVNLVGQGPIRNMYNPGALGDPNCYSSSIPNTEVHAAAGPQNHWFYLLAEGTNPPGKPSSTVCSGTATLTGIGIQKAGQIFMGGLNTKTVPWTHAKARVATLNAAKTLFPGSCTEFNATKAAWSAVSVPAQSNEPTCQVQGDDFSVSVSPASGTVDAGGSTTATLSTAVTNGNAQTLTLSATGAPSGTQVSFNPATVTAGQSSTVTIATSSGTPAGTSQIALKATGSTTSKTATFALTVGGGGPGPVEPPDISLAGVKAHLQQFQSIATANGGTRRSTGAGYTASVSYIEQKLTAAGYTVRRQSCTSGCTGGAGPNLIADWPGGDENQVIMAGAHLDSVAAGPGINDNASGSSALLEVALTLAATRPQMAKHVRFGWWTDEEQGLNGSEFYVNSLSSTDRSKIKTYHNYDMVGSTNGGYFINNITTEAARPLKEFYDRLNLQPEENTEGANRSDDASFRNAGIPTSGVAAGASATKTSAQASKWGGTAGRAFDPCYHQACDTTANINDTVLDRASDAAAYGVWKLAVGGGSEQDDFSVSVNPAAGTVQAGGSLTATLSTAVTRGAVQDITLSASGAPSGTTVAFDPATIKAGATSAVRITTSASTPAGTYPIELKATGTAASHSVTYTLTVGGTGGGRTFSNDTPFPIDDGYQDSTDIPVTLTGSPNATFEVTADIDHTCAQDLRLTLVQPNGTRRVLKYESYGSCTPYNGPVRFTVSNTARLGNGTWTLVVGDYFQNDTGTFNGWKITF